MCALATISREPDALSSKRQTTAIWSLPNTRLNMSSVFLKSCLCIATALNSMRCFSTSWYLRHVSRARDGKETHALVGFVKRSTPIDQPSICIVHRLVPRLGPIHSIIPPSRQVLDKVVLVLAYIHLLQTQEICFIGHQFG